MVTCDIDEPALDVWPRKCVTVAHDINDPAVDIWPHKCATGTSDVDEPALGVWPRKCVTVVRVSTRVVVVVVRNYFLL